MSDTNTTQMAGTIEPKRLPTTSPQILGPFYPLGTPSKGGDLTRVDGRPGQAQGQIIYLSGRVLDRSGRPVSNAKLEIWQANSFGRYTHPNDDNSAPLDPNFEGFAVVQTDSSGQYNLKGTSNNTSFHRPWWHQINRLTPGDCRPALFAASPVATRPFHQRSTDAPHNQLRRARPRSAPAAPVG